MPAFVFQFRIDNENNEKYNVTEGGFYAALYKAEGFFNKGQV